MKLAARSNGLWLISYVAVMVAITWAMWSWRQWAIRTLDTPQETENWEQWREEARQQAAGKGPIQRRVPRTSQPPAFVLLHDYFPTCLVGAVVFGSVLFWVLVFLLRGVLLSPPPTIRSD